VNDSVKLALAALTAGLVALAAVVSDGVTVEEAIGVVLAVLAALGGTGTYVQRARAERAEARARVAESEITSMRRGI